MKNKKTIVIVVVVVGLLIVAGILLKSNLDKRSSVEYVVQSQNEANKNKDVGSIWENMHPDDRLRWTEQEYMATFNEGAETYSSIETKSIKALAHWTHSITGKVYSDVAEVINAYTTAGSETPIDIATHFAKVDGD